MARDPDRPTIGPTARACHVLLRLFEIACSLIVLGLIARAVHLINQANIYRDGRVVYGLVTAAISTLFSILFVLPFLYAYMAAPFDVVMFIMCLIAFSLLAARTGTAMCSSGWYFNYWGWAWGRWYISGIPNPNWSWYDAPGCASFRVVLAFSFMASIAYLLSAILGGIVTSRYWKKGRPSSSAATTTSRNISAPIATNNTPQTGRGGQYPQTSEVPHGGSYSATRPAPPAQNPAGTPINV